MCIQVQLTNSSTLHGLLQIALIPRAHSLGGLAKASANVVAADKQALGPGYTEDYLSL